MIWQNPWAWLGLFALAVPVLIHLFARRAARVQRFPALRFLEATRLLPARRTRITNPLLLLVRMAILAAAVAALAQPYLTTAERNRAVAPVIARAIIVDSSASMQRLSTAGARAFEQAREAAARSVADAGTSTVIVSASPAQMLAGAAAWLATQPGTREIVIISDFQIGEFAPFDFNAIPEEIGVRFERIAISGGDAPLEATTNHGAVATVARVTPAPDRTAVEWRTMSSEAVAPNTVGLLVAAADQRSAEATLTAALAAGAPLPTDTTHNLAIVFPGHENHAQLMRDAQSLDQPWMGDVLTWLNADTTISRITRADIDGRSTMLLFTRSAPGTLQSAQLVTAVLRALAQSTPPDELEPETLADDVLARWQRNASPATRNNNDASDGRWFWLVALLLLGTETWLRRTRKHTVKAEAAREHAA